MQQSLEATVSQIGDFCETKVGIAKQFGRILSGGGGVEMLRKHILARCPSALVLPNAVMAPAIVVLPMLVVLSGPTLPLWLALILGLADSRWLS